MNVTRYLGVSFTIFGARLAGRMVFDVMLGAQSMA